MTMTKSQAGGCLITAGLLSVVVGFVLWQTADNDTSLFEKSADHTTSWVAFGLAGFLVLLGVILISGDRSASRN